MYRKSKSIYAAAIKNLKTNRKLSLILSATADMGFTEQQKQLTDLHCTKLPYHVKTIEGVGDSTRRMVAEIIKP